MEPSNLKEDISKIIYDGILAPSGENSQPWRFIVNDNVIFIINIKTRDTTLYNSGQHGSYVAHGALIENIAISATHFGYTTEISYFPEKELNPIAKIILTKRDGVIADPLYSYISKRQTNRSAYQTKKIDEVSKGNLMKEAITFEDGLFKIVDSRKEMDTLAHASTTAEKLLFKK